MFDHSSIKTRIAVVAALVVVALVALVFALGSDPSGTQGGPESADNPGSSSQFVAAVPDIGVLANPGSHSADTGRGKSSRSTTVTQQSDSKTSTSVRVTALGRDESGLKQVLAGDLPKQARLTLNLVKAGGPFPYRQDGAIFENREEILPGRARGYYREFTVETPGSDDRGARRLVIGREGEVYYTPDHYDSFLRVVL